MNDSVELLEQIADIFRAQGLIVETMLAPTDFDKDGKVISAQTIRFGSNILEDEVAEFLVENPMETVYLYKAGYIELPNESMPYMRVGRNIYDR